MCALGTQTIHAVTNPTGRLAGAVHVYGGDFVNQPRSQWGPDDLVERPFSMDTLRQQFVEGNEAAGLGAEPDRQVVDHSRPNQRRMRLVPNSALSAASVERRAVERAGRRLRRRGT